MNYRVPQSLAEFKALVAVVAEEKKISTTLAVYKLTDFFLSRAMNSPTPPVACERGCSACCYQIVTASPLEWREIETYLRQTTGLLAQLRDRIKNAVRQWREYKDRHPRMPSYMQVSTDFALKPCVFLDEPTGSCTIYPVRPLACRSMTSTKRCTLEDQSHAIGCRFIWDGPASLTVYQEHEVRLTTRESLMTHLQEWLDRSDLID